MGSAMKELQMLNGTQTIEKRIIDTSKITDEMINAILKEFKADSSGSYFDKSIAYPLDAAIGLGILVLHNENPEHKTKWDKSNKFTQQELIDYGALLSLMFIDGLAIRISFDEGTFNYIKSDDNPNSNLHLIRNELKIRHKRLTADIIKEFLNEFDAMVEGDVFTVSRKGIIVYQIKGNLVVK